MNRSFKESVVFKVVLCHPSAVRGLDVLGEHPQDTVTVLHHPAVVTYRWAAVAGGMRQLTQSRAS